jgi:hypothetical protein
LLFGRDKKISNGDETQLIVFRKPKGLTVTDGAVEMVGASDGAADFVGWLDSVGCNIKQNYNRLRRR